MGWRLHKTIVMVGMMGAGKTAVGRTLAALLGVPFLDSDEQIEDAAAMSIAEIFARWDLGVTAIGRATADGAARCRSTRRGARPIIR